MEWNNAQKWEETVGERKWRRKKGGGEIREIRRFKRGGPFQEILYFIYITEVRDYLFFSTRMLLFDTYLKLSWKKRIVRTTKVEIFTNEEKRWKIGGKKFREEIWNNILLKECARMNDDENFVAIMSRDKM